MCKNNKYSGISKYLFFLLLYFRLNFRWVSVITIMIGLQRSHDSSLLLIVLLLWSAADGNWRFSAVCYHAALNLCSFMIWDNDFLRCHSVKPKEYQFFFASYLYWVTVVFQTMAGLFCRCHSSLEDVCGLSWLITQSGEITTLVDPNPEVDWDNWIVVDYQIKIHFTDWNFPSLVWRYTWKNYSSLPLALLG